MDKSDDWRGTRMRHADGRTGKIVSDSDGGLSRTLSIQVDGSDQTEKITLNAWGRDTGARNWSWMYAREGEPEDWALLGDHNTKPLPEQPIPG